MIRRELAGLLEKAARSFPAVVLTGPRQCGKTTLLRLLRPDADYRLLEDPDELERVRSDPRAWLEACRPPVIIDEIQNAPELLGYIRSRIDARPRAGRWFLTGSQHFTLMKGVTESMAGRAAVLTLLPLSLTELAGGKKFPWSRIRRHLIRGLYPKPALGRAPERLWHSSYLQTYIERDIRQLTEVSDLSAFRRFLKYLAVQVGKPLNQSEIAGPLGVSVPTVRRWLSLLETTAQVHLVPPWYTNLGKRLVKSPRVYFTDPALACHLMDLDLKSATTGPFAGFLFENLLLAELLKFSARRGRQGEVHHFREHTGLEVDFVMNVRGAVWLIEAKTTSTPTPAMATGIRKVAELMKKTRTEGYVVTTDGPSGPLAPGVTTMSLAEFSRKKLRAERDNL